MFLKSYKFYTITNKNYTNLIEFLPDILQYINIFRRTYYYLESKGKTKEKETHEERLYLNEWNECYILKQTNEKENGSSP